MPRNIKNTKKRLTRVSVQAERREKPDWDRFAWALLQYARIVAQGETGKRRLKR
jgi:hypothetical protein